MSCPTGAQIAARAATQIGTPFRLRGRTPGIALDCIGLTAYALNVDNPPSDYSLKGTNIEVITSYMDSLALRRLAPSAVSHSGDIALVACADRQFHLMIAAQDGWLHSHAGLGKVVHMAGPSPWPIAGLWRAKDMSWQQ
jgi:murein DD-endopeptidase / murein LD-carboxypeptidase